MNEVVADVKVKASYAKKRICSGLWNNPNNTSITQDERIFLNTRRYVFKNMSQGAFPYTNLDNFFVDAYSIITSIDSVHNPLGKLINRNYYESLSQESKQRYVLNLSKAYVTVKSAYHKAKAIEEWAIVI